MLWSGGDEVLVESPDPMHPVRVYAGHGDGAGVTLAHVHQPLELGVVVRGRLDYVISGVPLQVTRGEVWLCGMWELHRWHEARPRTSVVVLSFLPEAVQHWALPEHHLLSMFSAPSGQRPRPVTLQGRRRVLAAAHEILEEARDQRPHWEILVHLCLMRLLFELERDWRITTPTPLQQAETSSPAFARVMHAIRLVNDTRGRRVTLREAAHACGLSVRRFSELFGRTMGTSFGRFELRSRLGHAAHCLASTEASVQTVSEMAGFTDASHLHRAIVKHFGCTPADYRREARLAPGLVGGLFSDSQLFTEVPQRTARGSREEGGLRRQRL